MSRAPLDRRNQVPSGVCALEPGAAEQLISSGNAVVIDVRTHTHFAEARVEGAVNVSIPSTLLKRLSFDFEKMCELVSANGATNLEGIEQRGALLYDQETASLELCGPNTLLWTMRKLRQYLDKKSSSAPLAFIVGGISAVPRGLIDRSPLPPNSQPVNPLPPVDTRGVARVPSGAQLFYPKSYSEHLADFSPWIRTLFEAQSQGRSKVAENWAELQTAEAVRINHSQSDQQLVAGDFGKNRYSNIAPYNHTRVLLNRTPDYINASYISSHYSPLRYIATQAPLPCTFDDFWQLVWDEDVPVIMMLTTLKSETGQVKGDKYWELGQYRDIELVNIESSAPSDGIVIRTITLARDGQERIVHQVHYQNWPDVACPNSSEDLFVLLDYKRQLLSRIDAPVVVHCSAGCGRTGTFCTVDTIISHLEQNLEEAKELKEDIVYQTIAEFRSQRLAMVQVQRQFLFCYDSIIKWYYSHFLD